MKKNMAAKTLFILLICIVPLLVISFLVFSLTADESRLTLFPGERIQTGAYSDAAEAGGKSIINGMSVNPERILFSYTLKKGYTPAYAGFAVRKKGLMDHSSYDVMRIRLRSTHSHSIRVILLAYIPGFTVDGDFSTYLLLQKEVVLRNENDAYSLILSDFFTPEWWWSSRDAAEDDPGFAGALGGIFSVSIQSGSAEPVDVTDTLLVTEISFLRNRQPLLAPALSVLAVWAAALALFFLVRRYKYSLRNRSNTVVTASRSTAADQGLDEPARTIIRYMGENYSNPRISVETVSRECGIPAARVPQCIKEHFGLHFPQYLTAIRLAEAKRLLLETDLTIAEIAYKIGFSSVPHFNRVFKSGEGTAPKNFRRKSAAGGTRHPALG
jgi:AraC-like DNA-binding protein